MPEIFAIEVRELSKSFPGVLANDRVSLQIRQNEIHALLGENGAGKSTLMSLIFGLYAPDSGEIRVQGEPCRIEGPSDANRYKIGMVHQHFQLIDSFSVADNIMLGAEKQKYGILQRKQVVREIEQLCQLHGLNLDPRKLISELTVGQQQKVEILKLLYRENDILIFDEPSAMLMPQEIKELLLLLQTLRNHGKTIILITHKLKEIRQVADRCTVMRQGKVIDTVEVEETSTEQLTKMMVGYSMNLNFSHMRQNLQASDANPVVFSCHNLSVYGESGALAVKDLSFELRKGEVLGLAGVDGNGQMELMQALSGLRPLHSGSIQLHGKDISQHSIRRRIEMGLVYVPADRQRYALVLEEDIGVNIALKGFHRMPFSEYGFLHFAPFSERAKGLIDAYDIRCSQGAATQVRLMSGGNQQKVILAREISSEPVVMLVEQPTRGLDIGAISYIYEQILRVRTNSAILLVSFDLDEVISLADRIAVISNGYIMGNMMADEVDELQIGYLMAGETL